MVVGIRKVLSFAIIVSMLTTNFCWAVGDDIESRSRTALAKPISVETVQAAYKGDPEAVALIKERLSHIQLTVQDALRRAKALEAARNLGASDIEEGVELRVSSSSSGRGSDEEKTPLLASDELGDQQRLLSTSPPSNGSSAKSSFGTGSEQLGTSPDQLGSSPDSHKSSPRDHSPRGDAGDPANGDEYPHELLFESDGIPASLHEAARAHKEFPEGDLKEFPEGDLAQTGSLAPYSSAPAEFEHAISPETAAKMMAFLNYFERYVVENRTTWKQRGAMVAAVVGSLLATMPYSPVYLNGVAYLEETTGTRWIHDDYSTILPLIAYIYTTSLIDITGRHISLNKDLFAPSASKFSIPHNRLKKALINLLSLPLAIAPAATQLYYFVEVESYNMEFTNSHGLSNEFAIELIVFSLPFFLDGYTFAQNQISSFLGRAADLLFGASIPPSPSNKLEVFRKETLNKLSAFKNALFWAPREMLELIYAAIFDPTIDTKIENTDLNATSEVKVVTKGLMQLQSILSLAKEFSFEKEETSASSVMVKGISTLMALAAAPMRFLTLQTVFSLMLTTFSGGYIPDDTAEIISIPLAVLGSFPQGFAEFEGNVEFSELFSSHKPHHHTAYPALRIPGQIFSVAHGIFNLIPLLSFCVFETDEHFDGNLAILAALSAPFIFPEFTSSVVALSLTYAQSLPYLIGRLGMGIARKFGAGTLTGEMRDELIRIVEGLERLVENLSPEVLFELTKLKTNESEI